MSHNLLQVGMANELGRSKRVRLTLHITLKSGKEAKIVALKDRTYTKGIVDAHCSSETEFPTAKPGRR